MPARGNLIEGNTISGWKMKTRCIQAAPGVKISETELPAGAMSDNVVRDNVCTDE